MRTLVACIVALSIPLQGLAATFMTHCAPGDSPTANTTEHADAHRHQQDAAVIAADCQGMHDHADAWQAAVGGGDHPSATTDCAHCAVCCAAMITQTAHAVAPASIAMHPAPAAMPVAIDRYPGSIERPPRCACA